MGAGSSATMNRVLVVYYSQSGEVAQVARLFADQLESVGAALTVEAIRPEADYPFPWRSLYRFFDTMPECLLGEAPPIRPLGVDPLARFDLIVIAYPVWFLSPALPMQAFFKSANAAALRGTDVITISISRAMWQRASETMKGLLAAAGANHCDNVVVTHQGSPLLTLISTPRALLFGRRDRLLGVFPRAGVSERDLARVRWLGSVAASRLAARVAGAPMLRGEPAVTVNRRLAVPELLAWYCFRGWAALLGRLGSVHAGLRVLGVYGFAVFLVGLVLIGLPLVLLGVLLAYPMIAYRLRAYVARLAAPTGELAKPTPVKHSMS
jgi:hypothetical protein